MKVFAMPRQTGKTHQLIIEASKNGAYIVCRRQMVDVIAERAREMKLHIPLPLSYDEFIDHRYYGVGIKSFMIDDVDEFLRYLTAVPISAISINMDDENKGKTEFVTLKDLGLKWLGGE